MKSVKAYLAVAAIIFFNFIAIPANADGLKNAVQVHGAWIDASGSKAVYESLTREDFHVTMVQEPETSFADDVAATKRVLASNIEK